MKRGYAIGLLAVAVMLCAGCVESKAGLEFSVNPITKTMTLRDRTDRALLIEDFDAGWGEGKWAKFKKLDARQDTTTVATVDYAGIVGQIKAHGDNLVAIGQQLNQMISSLLPVFQQMAVNAKPTEQIRSELIQGVVQELRRSGQIQGVPQAAQPK